MAKDVTVKNSEAQKEESNKRYLGRPFLRLIEAYVLDAIGHLSEEEHRLLKELEPKLRVTFASTDGWKEIVEREMEFPAELAIQIRQVWEKNKAIASGAGETLLPRDFTVMFVDDNFPPSTRK